MRPTISRSLSPGQLLQRADRLGRHLRAPLGRAVENAREQAEQLRMDVTIRADLARRLDDADTPGDLMLLTETEALGLLGRRSVGRLAYLARDGMPDIVPVNYAVDGRDILMRTAPGPKLQAALRRERVAFEVDDVDEDTRTGWSVIVHGRLREVPPEGSRTRDPEPWAAGCRRHTVRIETARVTGRRLL